MTGGLVPIHIWVTQGPERVRDVPEVTQQRREARPGASPREPCSLRARSLTSPQGQRGSAAAGRGALSLPGVLGLDSRQKPVLGPVPAPESAGGRPGTVLGEGEETQRQATESQGERDRDLEKETGPSVGSRSCSGSQPAGVQTQTQTKGVSGGHRALGASGRGLGKSHRQSGTHRGGRSPPPPPSEGPCPGPCP